MNLKQIEKRMKAIKTELESADADIDALTREFEDLKTKRAQLLAEKQRRDKLLSDIANEKIGHRTQSFGTGDDATEPVDPFGTEEYRAAFAKHMLGREMTAAESQLMQRAFTHTTSNTGAVVPTTLQNAIYSNMEEAHPILKDVQILRTGTIISVAKHVSIDEGDAAQVAEGVANDDEKNTFVNVQLTGKDFSKHIEFSYALGKMAIPAFEEYLIKEMGDRIGAAMAADVVATIVAGVNASNKINVATAGTLALADVTKAYGLLKASGGVNVYANNASIWNHIANVENATGKVSFISDASKQIAGQLIGKPIKEEDAAPANTLLILAPRAFVFNVIQDFMVERDKDIKRHVHIIAGYARAEGTLVNDLAAVVLTVGTAG